MKNEKKFLLFASCILVKGAKNSIICDLHRNFLYPIPDALYEIIDKYEGNSLEYIKSKYDNKYDEIIDEYFNALKEKDLIFFTNSPEHFPSLSMEWDEPFVITNAIVDIDKNIENAIKFIHELKEIACHTLQIRIFKSISLESIENILLSIEKGRISAVELIFPYNEYCKLEWLSSLCERFPRLSLLTIFAAPEQSMHRVKANRLGNIFFIKENLKSEKCCGKILPAFFTINTKTFTESKEFNSCLNRKISIDVNGNIKNCPSMSESFGNIEFTTLQQAINHSDFKKYWNINKDKIHICKDCEFRYICTDCRAYVENPEDIYSKPLKCGYNPYEGKWEKWSDNPLKKKATQYYEMQDLIGN